MATESAREQASKHKRENVTTRNSGESFFAHYGVSYARRYSIFTRTKKKKRICDERIFNCSLSHPSAPLVEPAIFFFDFCFILWAFSVPCLRVQNANEYLSFLIFHNRLKRQQQQF